MHTHLTIMYLQCARCCPKLFTNDDPFDPQLTILRELFVFCYSSSPTLEKTEAQKN
jgi:hypothetical protein